MPISSFMGLQTSLRGLLAHQRSLDVTGHNVANANTAGYSRQEAVLGSAPALALPPGAMPDGAGAHLGTGVQVDAYRRVRDGFLDVQYRVQSMRLGEEQAAARSLDQVELAFAEPGENGIAALLERFWSAWGDVANAPESPAARQGLVDQAKTVAAAFKTLDDQLATVAQQAREEYDSIVDPAQGQVVGIAEDIAWLNEQIISAKGVGAQPNDLLDRRDVLLDQLSALGKVSVTDQPSGAIEVAFGDAATRLIDASNTVNWAPPALTAPGGKLGALLTLSNDPGGLIRSYRDALNGATRTLADTVNAEHRVGSGVDFFSYGPGPAAQTLAVAVTPDGVRTSSTGAAGDNTIALKLSELRGGAADQAYAALVTRVGTEVRESVRRETNAEVLRDAVEDRRQSASGVSLDEEMTNLVRFQRGYQASARAMSTLDEALDVLINRTGRVGL